MIERTIGKYNTLKAGIDISGNEKSLAYAFGELSKEIAKSKETRIDVIKKKVLAILDSEDYNISDKTRYKNKQILNMKKDLFSLLAWINDVYLKGAGEGVIGSKKR